MKVRILACCLAICISIPPNVSARTCEELPGYPPLTPLPNFAPGQLYLNQFPGMLYDNSNNPPSNDAADGSTFAHQITPINGKVVFLSIGFSNNTIEFCGGNSFLGNDPDDPSATDCGAPVPLTNIPVCSPPNCPYNQVQSFMAQAFNDHTGQVRKNGSIVLVDGAKGGRVLVDWDPAAPPFGCGCTTEYDRVATILQNAGLSETQVQSIWIKDANPTPTHSLAEKGDIPDINIDAYRAQKHLGNIVRYIKTRYPNIKQVFISPRTYGGFANSSGNTLNPEPYAYEIGFSIKGLIRAQIQQVYNGANPDPLNGDLRYTAAPWLAWGPYLWADGHGPCTAGQVCLNSDFRYNWPDNPDGSNGNECTHPSTNGEQKVGLMLLNFLKSSTYTWWFRP